MKPSSVHVYSSLSLAILVVTTGVARAQSRGDCSFAEHRSVGVSLGRSSPYIEFSRDVVAANGNGSMHAGGGVQIAGRVDVPIAGPWRARVEASGSNWRVTRDIYDDRFQLIATETAGHVEARQIVAMIGRQGGRPGVCGYVLGGGGLYSLGYRGASVRSPGVAVTAGVEIPVGDRGAIHGDMQLQIINTRARLPIDMSHVLAASVSVGWSFRF